MVNGEKTLRYIAEKTALAVLFIVSLLAALLVIRLRAVIRMTAPIELSRTGLSVSMPQGNFWRCDGKWVFGGDDFTVSSISAIRGASVRSYARCRYALASRLTVQQQFNEDAAVIGGQVVETGRVDAGQIVAEKLVVDWARIIADEIEVISGVCELPGGRRLEIEVLQTGSEKGLVWSIFERIVKRIQYSDNGLLQAGIKMVDAVRETALALIDDNQPVFFILSDSKKKPIGFTMDTVEIQAGEEPRQVGVRAASYFYRRGLAANEDAGVFHSDAGFKQFDWRVVESTPRQGRKGVELSAESRVLTVRRIGAVSGEKRYSLGEAAVPDIVLEPVLQKLMETGPREIILDVIRSDGTIVPVYFEKIIPDGNSLKLEVLDGRGYKQQFDYDNDKQLTRKTVQQEDTYTFTRATTEQITKTFPERAELVLKREQVLDRDEL